MWFRQPVNMRNRTGYAYVAPLSSWMVLLFLVPLLIIVSYSFLKKGIYGGVVSQFSLDAYVSLWNPVLLKILANTLWISVVATVLMILVAIPVAYFIARSKKKTLWLGLIIIPFWTNFLVRIYAWIAILGNNGILNQFLLKIGAIHNTIQFLYNPTAIIVVLVYTYLPFAILPLYSTIEKFDFQLIEAARDLGATKFQAFRKVLIPAIRSGIVSAVLFCFIPAFGQYAVPQLIGDSHSYMIGNVIARELTITRNWPLSAALSTLLTFVSIMGVGLFMFQTGKKK